MSLNVDQIQINPLDTKENESEGVYYMDFIVLLHGIDSPLGDSAKDLEYVRSQLKTKWKEPLLVLIIKTNSNKTTDGIETGGRRVAIEIENEMNDYEMQFNEERVVADQKPLKIKFLLTLIGHSLGGVYARNCLKFLYENENLWSRILPIGIVTLSSPHLGVRRPPTIWNKAIDIAARIWYRGHTINELLLEDGDVKASEMDKKPLLYRMSVPDSVYMKALSKFQHRTLFSIIQRDFQVPYCSSSLLPKNYHDRTKINHFSVVAHSGFVEEYEHLYSKELAKEFDINHNGKQESEHDHETLHTYVIDNYNEISFLPAIMYNLNKVKWRRVDLDFNSNFCHDFLIRKPTIPVVVNAKVGELAIAQLVDLVLCDYQNVRKNII